MKEIYEERMTYDERMAEAKDKISNMDMGQLILLKIKLDMESGPDELLRFIDQCMIKILEDENSDLRTKLAKATEKPEVKHSGEGQAGFCGDCHGDGRCVGDSSSPSGPSPFGIIRYYRCTCGNEWREVECAT